VARIADSHCQLRNCSAGTIANTITGIDRARLISNRVRRAAASSGAVAGSSTAVAREGRGSRAV
jgi:hypothetical protein